MLVGLLSRVPGTVLVIAGIVSLQVGASIAKGLFDQLPPTTFVWLRLLTSAVVLLLIARPRLRGRSAADLSVVLAFGGCLALMNFSIYQAMARIPLGVAVTIEFLGPLTLAVIGSRRPSHLVWVLLAGAGVGLLGFDPHGLNLPGVAFALLAAASWAGYILLSAETGRRWTGISGLGLASTVGAVGLAAPAILAAGDQLLQPRLLITALLVGLMASVIPYSLELNALRRMSPRVFSILMSLEPAAATLAALVLLGEILQPLQWIAIGCVIIASIGATAGSRRARPPDPA